MNLTELVNIAGALQLLLFTAGIFFIALLTFLLTGVNIILNVKTKPLRENQVRMEKHIDRMETELKSEQKNIVNKINNIESTLNEITEFLLKTKKQS